MFRPRWSLRPIRTVRRTARSVVEAADAGVESALRAAAANSYGFQEPGPRVWDVIDAARELRQVPMQLQIDDGPALPVTLTEQNAGWLLEITSRVRDQREKERAAVPPVMDFGGHPWSEGAEG